LACSPSRVGASNAHHGARCGEALAVSATWNRGDGALPQGRQPGCSLGAFFDALPEASLAPREILTMEPNAVVLESMIAGTGTSANGGC